MRHLAVRCALRFGVLALVLLAKRVLSASPRCLLRQVFRDKEGRQVSKEAYLEEKAAAKKKAQYDSEQQLDWGGGLKQRVDASQRVAEMAAEAAKPFARSRDDRELDAMHRGRSRWGDPMVSEAVGGKGWLIAALCSSCVKKDLLCASHFLSALVLVDA